MKDLITHYVPPDSIKFVLNADDTAEKVEKLKFAFIGFVLRMD